MKLNPIAANMTEVELTDGSVVFFSYKTPVAAFVPGQGYLKTDHKWSVTTSKHITKWLAHQGVNNETAKKCTTRPQSFFDELV